MEHIPGFTRSHCQWMPPSGKCLRRIAPATAKAIDFGCKTQNTNKKQFFFLASYYHTFLLANQVTFET